MLLFAAAAGSLFLVGAATAEAGGGRDTESAVACKGKGISTADGCVHPRGARKAVLKITRELMAEKGLRAAILNVRVGRRTIVSKGIGSSLAGVKANPKMKFRSGSIAIPLLVNLMLQLRDQGRLSLDDRLSKWYPGYPNADRVTLRMLASTTTGYPDYAQENPVFIEALLDDVFRQWTDNELLAYAFAQPLICEPVTCFHYAHTNFVLLGNVLSKITGRTVKRLLRDRVIDPLGLKHTRSSKLPAIPSPYLHAYSSGRGPYEDSTFWSPSWGIGEGVMMTSTVGDVVKEARALASGRLLSKRTARLQSRNYAAGLPGQLPPGWGYGLGMLLANGWRFQNPFVNGFDGLMAHLPPRGITIAAVLTDGEAAAQVGNPLNTVLLERLGNYLAPQYPFPGTR
jgi:CubicO group peptidase (beta-lactamase class C family)